MPIFTLELKILLANGSTIIAVFHHMLNRKTLFVNQKKLLVKFMRLSKECSDTSFMFLKEVELEFFKNMIGILAFKHFNGKQKN